MYKVSVYLNNGTKVEFLRDHDTEMFGLCDAPWVVFTHTCGQCLVKSDKILAVISVKI